MKLKRTLVGLAAASAMLVAAGCQAVPVQLNHLPKDAERLAAAAAPREENRETSQYPARMIISDPIRGENVEITAAAEVLVPDAEDLPILSIEPDPLTLGECKRYAQILFDGQDMFAGGRRELEEHIAALQSALDSESDAEWRQSITEQLQSAQAELTAMPAGPVQLEDILQVSAGNCSLLDVVSQGHDGSSRRLRIVMSPDDAQYDLQYLMSEAGEPSVGNIWSTSSAAAMRQAKNAELTGGQLPEPDAVPDPGVTVNQAAAQADALMENLGLSDYRLESTDLVFGDINGRVQKGWLLNYTKAPAGIPLTFSSQTDHDFGSQPARETANGEVHSIWNGEVLEFLVCDAGIVRLTWKAPFVVSDTLTEKTDLLSFEEIQAVFAEMMPIVWAYPDPVVGDTERIEITEAQLGFSRVLDDTDTRGTLIPTWTFFGTRSIAEDGETVPGQVFNDPHEPLLTINAVNGTILSDNGLC